MSRLLSAFAIACAIGTIPIVIIATPTISNADDATDLTPILCPASLPNATWVAFTSPMIVNVPTATWNPSGGAGGVGAWYPTSQTIPFTVNSFALTTNIQRVMIGQGWYTPGLLPLSGVKD
jgi:hypothetical protein